MSLPLSDVRRLDDVSTHLRRGDSVLAVFPETTSFYAAVVYKAPKTVVPLGAVGGSNMEVVVKVINTTTYPSIYLPGTTIMDKYGSTTYPLLFLLPLPLPLLLLLLLLLLIDFHYH